MNPILAVMGTRDNRGTGTISNNQQNNMFGVINTIKAAKNPSAMLQHLASQNPNVANAMNLINKSGGDPKRAFYSEAQRFGIDPNQILGMLK